jgi:hypothetical protein
VFEQAWLVSKRLSLYSSVGNHTIAESVGLIFAGGMFRNTREGRKWIGTGVRLLDRELHHQVLDDGGPAEQSFNYHRFVLDLYWLAIDFLEMNNLHDCSDWRPRLTLGEAFLASFESGARLPAIGDSDDGYAIAPGVVPNRAHASADRPLRQTFLSSGYTILRTSTDAALVFDHGPLGMPPFHNHGHADALSVILTKENEEILVDPGTYRYNGEPEWRRYFKGTRAHNTVTIDGLDQAVQETSFIWSRPYKTRLARTSEQQGCAIVEALHDGYARLKHPVYHTRTVLLLSGKDFLIKDTFSGEGDHRFEVNFHLHPEAVAVCEGPWFSLQRGPATISVRLLDDDRLKLAGGQESPLLGWYSPAYGVKVESRVLTCAKKGRPGEISFAALICTGDDRPDVGRLAEMACQA